MDRDKEIKAVHDLDAIGEVVKLADAIWRKHYTSIIGEDQVNYMLEKFQSAPAINSQIKEGACYFLIYYKDSPSGYLSYSLREDCLFLSKIYVMSSLRGLGLGRFAIDFIEQQAISEQLNCMTLTVNKNNLNTIAAYKKMGFEIEEAIVMDIGDGYVMDDYRMTKRL